MVEGDPWYKIESGRWGRNSIPRGERKCEICNVIESEYHVLIECPRFVNERKDRLPTCLVENPSEEEFLRVLGSSEVHVQTMLGLLCLNVEKEYLKYV